MKILIDIKHPAQLNLFKGLSGELAARGWDVTISYLNRGKLPGIINKEYSGFPCIPVGSSRGSKWSIFWNGNVVRTLRFFSLIIKNKYNICISASSIPLAAACFVTATPVIQFYDDPERKQINNINALLSSKIFFPPIVKASRKVGIFNCLKEWSYLSPARFNPDVQALAAYGLTAHEYIFIREVSNKSFNYYSQQDAIISAFAHRLAPGVQVVLSLEDKSYAKKYPERWIILREPVAGIHSLLYYARLVLSSGDSMAREGAMLGVPAVYCGIRDMKANRLLMTEATLHHHPLEAGADAVHAILLKPFNPCAQQAVRKALYAKWDDMTDFMHIQINRYKK